MDPLFARLKLADVQADLIRNIVSIRASQDLFDDLSDDPTAWSLAQRIEDEVKPPAYRSSVPLIDRPFEDAAWFSAIAWPFRHWQSSRFSDGTFGVWYGAASVETSVRETVFHWYKGLLSDAGFEHEKVIGERKLYSVACAAALLDLRPLCTRHGRLMHASDYAYCQSVGTRIKHEGHPGLVTRSVRHAGGENHAVFNPAVLSNPRDHSQLTYRLDGKRIVVEKKPGVAWMRIAISEL